MFPFIKTDAVVKTRSSGQDKIIVLMFSVLVILDYNYPQTADCYHSSVRSTSQHYTSTPLPSFRSSTLCKMALEIVKDGLNIATGLAGPLISKLMQKEDQLTTPEPLVLAQPGWSWNGIGRGLNKYSKMVRINKVFL